MKYFKISLLLIIAVVMVAPLMAQLSPAQRTYLQKFAREKAKKYEQNQAEVSRYAERNKLETVHYKDGNKMLMVRIVNGTPIYKGLYNYNSIRTINAEDVKENGALGLDLSGADQNLAIWDGGRVLGTHQEFGGRVTWGDAASIGLSSHSTHVAGTMIAAGVDTLAEGFSNAANLRAYDFGNDISEMTNAVLNFDIEASNHSYGAFAGWDPTSTDTGILWRWYGDATATIDWKFGAYDQDAQDWDDLAYNSPFYLIVKSAGNERNDSGPGPGGTHFLGNSNITSTMTRQADGGALGYDCIPTEGNAKNILTVGATNDLASGYSGPGSVTLTGFSSWGPTDDGRVKPDIVANGASLYSTDTLSNADYSTKSGTSMSAPSVTGSVGLLLEHWENHNPTHIRAASMKGLLLHTADDAGNTGPDYSFGWGLANISTAADLISTHAFDGCTQLIEGSIDSEGTEEIEIHACGQIPLIVTLIWADPPSPTINTGTINPVGANYLVNDLNLRLDSDGGTSFPWVLNPATPTATATTGNNSRDNVEQILLTSPDEGMYTIRIVAPVMADAQDYTLIISGNDAMTEDRTIANAILDQDSVFATRRDLTFGPMVEVTAGADVKGFAGRCVTLTPGFNVSAGNEFLARIEKGGGCASATPGIGSSFASTSIEHSQTEASDPITARSVEIEQNQAVSPLLKVYPNPTHGMATLEYSLTEADKVHLYLTNGLGTQVMSLHNNKVLDKGKHLLSIDGNQLVPGLYYCVLQTSKERIIKQLIIAR